MPSFSGSGSKLKTFETLTKGQRSKLQDYIKAIHPGAFNVSKDKGFREAGHYYQYLMDPNSKLNQKMQAPYLRQYEEEIVPHVAEGFAGADAMDSGAFNLAMSKEASGLQERLAGLTEQNQLMGAQGAMEYGQVQPQLWQGLMNTGMRTSGFDYAMIPGKESMTNSVLNNLGKSLPLILAALA